MPGESSIWNALYQHKARRTKKKQGHLSRFIRPEYSLLLEMFVASGQNRETIKSVNPNLTCIGIDYNFELCRIANRNGFISVAGDCSNMPFKEKSFDLIYLNSLHHVSESAGEVLRKSTEMLKPAGVLVGVEPYGFMAALSAKIIYYMPDFIISLLPKNLRNYVRAIKFECRNEGVLNWYYGPYDIKRDLRKYNIIYLRYDPLRIYYCIRGLP